MKKLPLILIVFTCLTIGMAHSANMLESGETLPPPERKIMTIDELVVHQADLKGKVIKTSINIVKKVAQIQPGWSLAQCAYRYDSGAPTFHPVLVPKDGCDFFEKMAEKSGISSKKTIYLLVNTHPTLTKGLSPATLEAVGTRYKKNKNEYDW